MSFPSEGPYFITVKGKVTDADEGQLVLSGPAQNIQSVSMIPFILTQTAIKEIAFYKSIQHQQKHASIIMYFSPDLLSV
jgi:hypothetical protein